MTRGAKGLISWAALEKRPELHLGGGGGGARGQRLREGDRAAYSRNCRHVKYLCGVQREVGGRPGRRASGLQGPAQTQNLSLGGGGPGGHRKLPGGPSASVGELSPPRAPALMFQLVGWELVSLSAVWPPEPQHPPRGKLSLRGLQPEARLHPAGVGAAPTFRRWQLALDSLTWERTAAPRGAVATKPQGTVTLSMSCGTFQTCPPARSPFRNPWEKGRGPVPLALLSCAVRCSRTQHRGPTRPATFPACPSAPPQAAVRKGVDGSGGPQPARPLRHGQRLLPSAASLR